MLDAEQDDGVAPDDYRFPEHNYPSDFELWLEPDGVVRVRAGIQITELSASEARDLGQALVELADAADGQPQPCRGVQV